MSECLQAKVIRRWDALSGNVRLLNKAPSVAASQRDNLGLSVSLGSTVDASVTDITGHLSASCRFICIIDEPEYPPLDCEQSGRLYATVVPSGDMLSAYVRLSNKGLTVYMTKSGGAKLSSSLLNIPARLRVSDNAEHLCVRCGIVCSITELYNYLKVSPIDVQWITPDCGVIYTVESDLQWIILTS